ncbi:hypothetical protein DY000_02020439 [Brassica cretica]|uniref:RING-type domain-containing protein n=1 Tax=Brassica cretica TaxID=69181 RepID=A0ABQ7EMI1_BRACR|nr:hypothetical protein DY000_02020439 [Brassica cretica]
MDPPQDYALFFESKLYPESLEVRRDLTININRWNTNQTDISIPLEFSTTPFRYLSDTTVDVMQHMLTYHDMGIYSASRITEQTSTYVYNTVTSLANYDETSVHIVLHLTDFNPHSIHRLDVDVATADLQTNKRAPYATEEGELCNICMNKVESGEFINALHCNHIYHHQCIIDWIRMNIRCPTCRDTIS